jgi:hypothetical protein
MLIALPTKSVFISEAALLPKNEANGFKWSENVII